MAQGALARTGADLAVSITGVAGPGGGSDEKPVGLVHFALARLGEETATRVERFGDIGREGVRQASVRVALEMLMRGIQEE
jgi:nicotinamide-nucleotide amidase